MDRIDKKREIRKNSQTNFKIRRTVNTIFGLIQTTLVFRLIFKIFGANAENQFAKIIYEITDYFEGFFLHKDKVICI